MQSEQSKECSVLVIIKSGQIIIILFRIQMQLQANHMM
jgi:hypothetical protein